MSISPQETRENAQKLQMAANNLNAVITQVERAFSEGNPGVHASVPLNSSPQRGKTPKPRFLTYCKHHGRWGLYVQCEDEYSRLLNCSLETRTEATWRFQDLYQAMSVQIQAELSAVERAVQIGEIALAGLKTGAEDDKCPSP